MRPITDLKQFELAMKNSNLSEVELQIIDYIRFVGVFNQPNLTKQLKLNTKPPALSVLCKACRKIGIYMPEHFSKVRMWSEEVSLHNVHWDGDLVCSTTFNIDGDRLTPEERTSQFHNFAVHKELFIGLD